MDLGLQALQMSSRGDVAQALCSGGMAFCCGHAAECPSAAPHCLAGAPGERTFSGIHAFSCVN